VVLLEKNHTLDVGGVAKTRIIYAITLAPVVDSLIPK